MQFYFLLDGYLFLLLFHFSDRNKSHLICYITSKKEDYSLNIQKGLQTKQGQFQQGIFMSYKNLFAIAFGVLQGGRDGSSITIDIIIIIQPQLAKLLQKMQAETHQRLQEEHTQPSDNSSMHAHPSLASNFQEKVQPDNQGKIVKIQNEGEFSFHAFQVSEKSLSSPDQIADGTYKKPSVFHNFQKHLITTLRTHITFRSGRTNEPSDHLMVSLWNYFMKSNKPTKKYLYGLLMTLPHSLVEFHQKSKKQEEEDEFSRVLQEASQEEIKEAQSKLRYQLMRQSKRLLEEGQLNHRRMRRLDEFKQYFGTFIEDLESGALNLRLPKKNKTVGSGIKKVEAVLIMKKDTEQ